MSELPKTTRQLQRADAAEVAAKMVRGGQTHANIWPEAGRVRVEFHTPDGVQHSTVPVTELRRHLAGLFLASAPGYSMWSPPGIPKEVERQLRQVTLDLRAWAEA